MMVDFGRNRQFLSKICCYFVTHTKKVTESNKMDQSKDSVRMRMRTISGGKQSLYLDIYVNGKREYEFLKLYIIPERTREDKKKNEETMRLAEAIRGKRLVEVQNKRYGFESVYKLDTRFLDYYRAMCDKRLGEMSNGNWGNWWSALKHLEKFCKRTPNITFRDITPEWIESFKEYLDKDARVRRTGFGHTDESDKPLSQNSKQSYFNKVRACINQAFDEKIIPHNPLRGIEGFKSGETHRNYLTVEEIRALSRTDCKYPSLKRAFLFSCLTGIRKSDIEKMRWREVQKHGDYTRIIFTQKKTSSMEYLDISPEAEIYLGERKNPDDRGFAGFKYDAGTITELRMWCMRAGISKDITFHCARHSFAVMMIDLGADIYTVQKLLGHEEIRTTEIYTKLLDKKKQAAVLLIPKLDL